MEERSVQIFIPYERSFTLVFSEKEWFVGGVFSLNSIALQADYVTVVEDRPLMSIK